MAARGHASTTNDSTQHLREAVKCLRVYVAAFTCHTVTGSLRRRLAHYGDDLRCFPGPQNRDYHVLRFTALLHRCIAALQPSHCSIAAVGITTSLHAQHTVANFAACQHPRIAIFHILRFTALLHRCIAAWQGSVIQHTQQMFHCFPGGMRGTHPVTHTDTHSHYTLQRLRCGHTFTFFCIFHAVEL